MSRYASELHHMRSAVKVMPVAVDIDNNDRYLGIVTVELKSVAEFKTTMLLSAMAILQYQQPLGSREQ